MRKHFRLLKREHSESKRKSAAGSTWTSAPGLEPTGYLAAWSEVVSPKLLPEVGKRRERKPRVALADLLSAQVFHLMNAAGTLAEHFGMLFEDALVDSACADRRRRLPWQVFSELLRRALRRLVSRRRHPEGFWRGWRLLAMDGTQFSVTNTPVIKATQRTAQARRGRAAFVKIVTGVLLEVGLHNPLAVAIGQKTQSEWELALSLLAQRPKGALLLADRLHGCAAFAAQALRACRRVGSHFLFRARAQIRVQRVRRLRDGSRLVRVPVRQQGQPRVIVQWLQLREMRVQIGRKGFRTFPLRLWTTLLDPKLAPACELVELYAKRWEHEWFYRELKHQLRKSKVLQSHTMATAVQAIAALMLAAALLARARERAAAGKVPVLRVSFTKLLELLRPLWLVFALGNDLLQAQQRRQLIQRFYAQARRCLTQKRRSRSCKRALRQPVGGWPRLRKNHSWQGPIQFKFV